MAWHPTILCHHPSVTTTRTTPTLATTMTTVTVATATVSNSITAAVTLAAALPHGHGYQRCVVAIITAVIATPSRSQPL